MCNGKSCCDGRCPSHHTTLLPQQNRLLPSVGAVLKTTTTTILTHQGCPYHLVPPHQDLDVICASSASHNARQVGLSAITTCTYNTRETLTKISEMPYRRSSAPKYALLTNVQNTPSNLEPSTLAEKLVQRPKWPLQSQCNVR
jgi:hypothetical protein